MQVAEKKNKNVTKGDKYSPTFSGPQFPHM